MGEASFLSIGNFSRLSRISIRSLRFYDEIQLLLPQFVDPSSGYRFYTADQLKEAEKIRLLRSLDVPLENIREILSGTDETVEQVIEQHKCRLRQQIEELKRTLQHLDRVSMHHRDIRPTLETEGPSKILSLGLMTGLSGIEPTRERTSRMLLRYAEEQGLKPVSPYMELRSVFINDQKDLFKPEMVAAVCPKDDPFEIELAYAVEGNAEVKSPFLLRELPAGTYLTLTHLGPYEPLHLVHQAMLEYVQKNDMTFMGGIREVYLKGPQDTSNADEWITRVQYEVSV
ncbi:MerR family transcriptional regulator [Deinococcus cellulosilyticus]|uniref:HTH merR-type domain-containing protein n=1 Tax=Deinococcus cellulosilyticus (strain DSM 18568 / NBRC 106333 / KACC 11606 / 5516J-15) TaxID=1223518 RepID=A0A511MZZ6_DEIC1|nr:MerR family transcriptional regulator [Deinococcus cellulosilyticus]GEM46205.1 hypothetical protein DC3_18400 [Deinococcus cellulosilyticus NBRC 106333 = KACC 11606]